MFAQKLFPLAGFLHIPKKCYFYTMKIITNSIGVKTIVFAETFEGEALVQVKRLIEFEAYQSSKIRIMPDAHAGKGCTIGTTMTIDDKVTPNLVGVDIGCGMLTIKLKNNEIDFEKLDAVIKAKIPSGFNVHQKAQKEFDFSNLRCQKHVDIGRAMLSIGSLGGGNHFIELGKYDKTGDLYLIIHSGSRKLGGDVCNYYQDKAVQLSGAHIKPKDLEKKLKAEGRENEIDFQILKLKSAISYRDLAYLTGGDFLDYMNDMAIVQKFAGLNRETMADIIINEMSLQETERFETIHNYIDFTRMILRKGAVSAEKGEQLLIPMNMRDGSLLCVGKGNENWNFSAPHGAGRLMSRSKAFQKLNMNDFKESMKGVYSSSVLAKTLDEAPQAYKSMKEIRLAIADTVDVLGVIKPLYNFKAH